MPDAPPPESPPPAADDSADVPLDRVVDDDTPRTEAIEWAVEQLFNDRPFEEIRDALLAGGWDEDAAAAIVEESRRLTRRHRGALTRDQVVFESDRMYRRATGRWFVGLPMIAAAWRLLHSVATLLTLRRAGRNPRHPS